MNSRFRKLLWIIASILISGLCWFNANKLNGDFGYLIWVAPIPIILCSLKTKGRYSFLIAFIAYFIGRLSWFSYLVTVITIIPTILFTIVFSLIFALIIIATREIVIKTDAYYSVFAFPFLFSTFEFLLINFSPDGSAGSISYSQSNYLHIIQIASITGIIGITFLVTLIPSAVALGWYFRKNIFKLRKVIGVTGLIFSFAIFFGNYRLNFHKTNREIKVGLAVLDERFHYITDHPDFQKEILVAENYANKIAILASQGAKIVVLPERSLNINTETEKEIILSFSTVAKQNHVYVILGYTNFRKATLRNSTLVIDTNGIVVVDYNKVHLVKGLEDQFTNGDKIGLFNLNGIETGTAICKDLDFPNFINKYKNVSVLAIPAWDFVVDGWLHSRMAVLRGVENGFSEIRTARQGRLTLSDCYGRIVGEVDCSNGKAITMLGNLSLNKENTFYSRFGNWFGILNLMGSLLLLLKIKRS